MLSQKSFYIPKKHSTGYTLITKKKSEMILTIINVPEDFLLIFKRILIQQITEYFFQS